MLKSISRALPVIFFILFLLAATTAQARVPRTLGLVKQVALSDSSTCVIKQDDHLRCWGALMDIPKDLGSVKQIAAGSIPGTSPASYVCAVKQDDGVTCWSSIYTCPSGIGYGDCTPDPGYVDTVSEDLGKVKKVSVGSTSTCGLGLDDRVSCSDGDLQVNGKPVEPDPVSLVPAELRSAGAALDVAAGVAPIACAVKNNGGVLCWGDDSDGNQLTQVPLALQNAGAAKRVFVGSESVCAIRQNNLLTCWGRGAQPANPDSLVPPKNLGEVRDLSMARGANCALLLSNQVRCWGFPDIPESAQSTLNSINSISLSGSHTCLSQSNGKLYCWGSDYDGQLSGAPRSPMRITPARSYEQSLALDWRWGCHGDLGSKQGRTFWRDLAMVETAFGDAWRDCQYVRPWRSSNKLSVSRKAFGWSNHPQAVIYLWQKARKTGRGSKTRPATWSNISSATLPAYSLNSKDRGYYFRACSIAQNQDGTSPLTCSLSRGPF